MTVMTREQLIQLQAADTILRRGVKVPVVVSPLPLRLLGVRRLSIKLWQPPLGALHMMSKIVMGMGLSPADFKDLTVAECYKIIEQHTDASLQLVSIGVLRRPPLVWFYKAFARWLRWRIEPAMFAGAVSILLTINDAGAFVSSIRLLTERIPNTLSPKNQGGHEAE